MGYFENISLLKRYFKISGKKSDFTRLPISKKRTYLGEYYLIQHKNKPYIRRIDDLYSSFSRPFTIILKDLNIKIKIFRDRIQRILVPRFFHDRRQTNVLKDLIFIGEKTNIDSQFSKFKAIGRKLYEYRAPNQSTSEYRPQEIDLPFPEKYIEDFTFTVSGFSFKVNGTNKIKEKLNPSSNLINFETNTISEQNTISDEIFYPAIKYLKEKIAEYDAIPTKNFINESYFLYDKSNLIKITFVTAINKYLNLYRSFSYFLGKSSIFNLKLISFSDVLKFLVEQNSQISNLKFQLAQINGSNVKATDNKIHHFSIMKLGKKRKRQMSEPIETVIIRTQQDFDVDGGLNPIQVEIKDNNIINLLKKYKNVVYKITPIGLLFPASLTNDTTQVFVLGKNLSGVKKSILNEKLLTF